jgi:formyltetrahydrofolate-dependent phosphoribosylglycinamide formyltransferase
MELKLISGQSNGNLEKLFERWQKRNLKPGWQKQVDKTIEFLNYIQNNIEAPPHWIVFSHMVWIQFGEIDNFNWYPKNIKLTATISGGRYHFSYWSNDKTTLIEKEVNTLSEVHEIITEQLSEITGTSKVRPKRLVILISGSGTNLQAIIDACKNGILNAKVSLVISNRKAAYGLERAEQANIPTLYFPLKPYTDASKSRTEYDTDLAKIIDLEAPDLIVLAGFMHIFTPIFTKIFPNTINLHPALPGQFPGAHGIEDAFNAFKRGEITESGCMIHVVTPELDAGPVITTRVIPFEDGDTLESFTTRLHAAEHELIIEGIQKYLQTHS